ncbi:serine hydrolase domain-containing protein [Candidatus Protochlamydia phocaeensis]|uniref:serine hydrolase domain-containing protein n=1 Tax=Candidatus Protochlamydia phocaeensis TaxID=1414722 RepID=UPI000837BF36|nr:serine hydrolase domain-containing protein [Candidatus Protochlamydia phocaeensis]
MIKVKPEEVGLSSGRLSQINKLVQSYIQAELVPGAIALVARRGKIAHFGTYGKMDVENEKFMREEAIFRLYSMTKPIIAVALLVLYEQGHFQLSDPVSKFIPEFLSLGVFEEGTATQFSTVPAGREMTIRDLLLHTSGLTHYLLNLSPVGDMYRSAGIVGMHSERDLKHMIQQLSQLPLAFQPGKQWHYSISYDVIAYLIEYFSGMRLDEFINKKITAPLNMLDTAFHLPKHKQNRFTTLYSKDSSQIVASKLVRADEERHTTHFFNSPSFLSGGGGMVSTGMDYLRFCQMLLNRGEMDGNRILSRKTIELMTTNHLAGDLGQFSQEGISHEISPEGIGFGLGVAVMLDPAKAQILGTPGEYSWNGMASTSFFIDPKEELIGIFLTQVMPSHHYSFQRDFRVAVYQSLLN